MKSKWALIGIVLMGLLCIGTAKAEERAVYRHYTADFETFVETDSDILVNESRRDESQSCTTSGYCLGYGYNFSSGHYEYHYGYQVSCNGKQERTVTTRTYKRSNGSTYDDVSYGWWSSCRI